MTCHLICFNNINIFVYVNACKNMFWSVIRVINICNMFTHFNIILDSVYMSYAYVLHHAAFSHIIEWI